MTEEQTKTKEDISKTYNIIKDLKNYICLVKNTSSFEELDVLISEIKSYIFNDNDLKYEFNKRIEIYKTSDYYRHLDHFGTIAYNAVLNTIKQEKDTKEKEVVLKNLSIKCKRTLPDVGYYYILAEIMHNSNNEIQSYNSICEFYFENLLQYLKVYIDKNILNSDINAKTNYLLQKIKQSHRILGKKVINNIDFIALKFEDNVVYNRAAIITNEFYTVWIKSALLGVLHELQIFKKIQVEDKEFKINIKKREIIENILNSKFNDDFKEIIIEILKNPKISIPELSEIVFLSENTVKNRLRNIRNFFEIKNGELQKVKELLAEYNFSVSDFT